MKLSVYDILLAPLITEKVAQATKSANQYGFRVHPKSNKKEIKSAVEKIFNVQVNAVNTINVGGKWRRVRYQPGLTQDWKKAIVTLKQGETIDLTK